MVSVQLTLIIATTFATAGNAAHTNRERLREGDVCKEGPPSSYCRHIKDCQGIDQSERKPEVCSYDGEEPIVCCDIGGEQKEITTITLPAQSTESIADKMCKVYAKYVYRLEEPLIPLPNQPKRNVSHCGIVAKPLILGGQDAKRREFPHMARIGFEYEDNTYWHCAGSLISENFILSAAHCSGFKFMEKGYLAKWAQLGVFDTTKDQEKHGVVNIKIVKIYDHPKYNSEFNYHDISLYKLEKNAPLGINIRPICLNTNKVIPSGLEALATGWGLTDPVDQSSSSKILQKVGLPIIPNKKCDRSYKQITNLNVIAKNRILEGIVDSMVCAEAPGKDSCSGDSGGPLQIPIRYPYCMYSQIGVISFGVNCSVGFPGVYMNVASYVPWIEEIVWQPSRAGDQSAPTIAAVVISLLVSLKIGNS